MAKAVSPSQRIAAWTVLVLLAAVAAWLWTAQARFNPAVVAALNPPPPAGAISSDAGDESAAFASAALIPEVPGFASSGPIESYGPETLSDKIDGKAELYLASGFREMSCRAFAPAQGQSGAKPLRLEIFVFEMTEPKAAFAVFAGQRRQGAEDAILPGLSEAGGRAYATTNALFFTLGARYVEIVADREGTDVAPALEAAAGAVLARLSGEAAAPSKSSVEPSALFPQAGLVADSVRLAMNDALGMEGFREVYTAEYALTGPVAGEGSAFVAERATPEEAVSQARAYADFLRSLGYADALKIPEGLPPGGLVLEQAGDVRIVFTVGPRLAGVFEATSPEVAAELARELARSLEKGP